jgi:hypothetical protein
MKILSASLELANLRVRCWNVSLQMRRKHFEWNLVKTFRISCYFAKCILHDRNCDWLKCEAPEGSVCNKQLKALLWPILPDIRNSASPGCPSDKSCIKMKIYLEHWWNDTAKGIRSTRRTASPTATLSAKDFTWSGASPTATIFTTDLTWSGPAWNAVLRGEGRATDSFSYGTPVK